MGCYHTKEMDYPSFLRMPLPSIGIFLRKRGGFRHAHRHGAAVVVVIAVVSVFFWSADAASNGNQSLARVFENPVLHAVSGFFGLEQGTPKLAIGVANLSCA